MAKIDVFDILQTKKQTPLEFDYDNLWIPPMHFYLTPDDVESLRRIATSLRLSSKIELKYKMIDDIMRNRGFRRFSAGTNRVVYYFLEDTRFVVKIAIDRVGMQDNPMEFKNQALLKPYCAKMFYISPCGTVGFAERVLPIKNKEEFKQIAPDVFEILVNKILGQYVVEDVGTKYFMNWGIRKFDAPVLLDYPFIYKLDGKKLFCNKVHPITNEPCNGEIDYDVGFNHLTCTRCGKVYLATDLRDNSIDNKIIIKGGIQMKIVLKKGDEIVSTPIPTDDVMTRPKRKQRYSTNGLVVKTSGGYYINHEDTEDDGRKVKESTLKLPNTDIDFDFDTKSKFINDQNDNDSNSSSSDDATDSNVTNNENSENNGTFDTVDEDTTRSTDVSVEDASAKTVVMENPDEGIDTIAELVDYVNSNTSDTDEEDSNNDSNEDEIKINLDYDSLNVTAQEGKSKLLDNYDDFDDSEEPKYTPIRKKSSSEEKSSSKKRKTSEKTTKRIPKQ